MNLNLSFTNSQVSPSNGLNGFYPLSITHELTENENAIA